MFVRAIVRAIGAMVAHLIPVLVFPKGYPFKSDMAHPLFFASWETFSGSCLLCHSLPRLPEPFDFLIRAWYFGVGRNIWG